MINNQVVDKKFDISWRFDVDPNFDYLVRLHFCDFVSDKLNQRIFKIYINKKTAEYNYDAYTHAKGRNKAYHEDFVDTVSQQIDTLWLQLGPDSMNGAPMQFSMGWRYLSLAKMGILLMFWVGLMLEEGLLAISQRVSLCRESLWLEFL